VDECHFVGAGEGAGFLGEGFATEFAARGFD
jgi:hypothetical protein